MISIRILCIFFIFSIILLTPYHLFYILWKWIYCIDSCVSKLCTNMKCTLIGMTWENGKDGEYDKNVNLSLQRRNKILPKELAWKSFLTREEKSFMMLTTIAMVTAKWDVTEGKKELYCLANRNIALHLS